MEWRFDPGGNLVALVYRLHDVAPQSPERSVLVVAKPAGEGVAGCTVARIDGSTPDANARAREIADAQAREFACGNRSPRLVGNAE